MWVEGFLGSHRPNSIPKGTQEPVKSKCRLTDRMRLCIVCVGVPKGKEQIRDTNKHIYIYIGLSLSLYIIYMRIYIYISCLQSQHVLQLCLQERCRVSNQRPFVPARSSRICGPLLGSMTLAWYIHIKTFFPPCKLFGLQVSKLIQYAKSIHTQFVSLQMLF